MRIRFSVPRHWRACANGNVEVYQNGVWLGSRDVSSWSLYASSGQIGFTVNGGTTTKLDNFGGGTYTGSLPSQTDSAFRTVAYSSPRASEANTPAIVVTPPANQTWKKYYYLGGRRIALRIVRNGQADEVNYLHGDHLGSTSLTTNASGVRVADARYLPFGGNRPGYSNNLPTDYRFTGQRQENFGLYDYGARFYDPLLGRFISADSIVPGAGNPQSLNRYAYVLNSPLKYIDPSGHWTEDELKEYLGDDWHEFYFGDGGLFKGRTKLLEFLRSKNTTDLKELRIISMMLGATRPLASAGIRLGKDVDAIGMRLVGSLGTTGQVSLSLDAILNLRSGEFSVFGSLGAGVLAGETIDLVGGLAIFYNLPNNKRYQGGAGAIGVVEGDVVAGNLEYFWGSPLPDNFSLNGVPQGYFLGGGIGKAIGVYGSGSYAVEVLRVNKSGDKWLPDRHFEDLTTFTYLPFDVVGSIAQTLKHDFVENWSRYWR